MTPRSLTSRFLTIVVFAGLAACGPADQGGSDAGAASDTAASSSGSYEAGTLTVVAKDFEFKAPKEIPSGWTTIRLRNVGEQDHFAYVYRLPDTVSFRQYKQQVVDTFEDVWNRYASGQLDRQQTLKTLGEELPGWFVTGLVPAGGVALTDAGKTASATVKLEPGTYAIECYVKTPKGTWHTNRGMVKELVVTEESAGTEAPTPDVTLTLSNYEIATQGQLTAGEQTIEVRVTDTPEGLMKHDINLVRLEEGTSVDSVVAWMDWMDLDEFRSPAPGVNLGGVSHMAEGRTGYMTVDLVPGRYVLLSEEYAPKGMVHEFTIE